jgi:two-component sensor histidine kinase
MPNTDILLRELNHRVKNNFQIILSLINLKKRSVPPERRDDIRFIQEHVQALAISYRLVYANGDIFECAITELLVDLVSELRQTAGLGPTQLRLDCAAVSGTIGLDQAISLGLYLAVLLAPYFDQAATHKGTVSLTFAVADNLMTFVVRGDWGRPVTPDFLRQSLCKSYFDLLRAEILPAAAPEELRVRLPLDERRPQSPIAGRR